jgi:hypothetical protein
MHKDGQMTKQMKEEIRKKNMMQRDIYDAQNLGRFHRCYPSTDPVSMLQLTFEGTASKIRCSSKPCSCTVERIKWHEARLEHIDKSSQCSLGCSHQRNIHE